MVTVASGIAHPARGRAPGISVFATLLVVVALGLAGCKTMPNAIGNLPGIKQIGQATGIAPTEEERIAAVLDDVQRGLETRQIYKVLSHVAGNYHDAEGRNYEAIQATLQGLFKNYKGIRVTRVAPRITVQGSRARVVDSFGTVAEPFNAQKDPPINIQGQVSIMLEKAANEWVIVEWSSLL